MMYTCDISKNLKDGIARLHTEDGKMMLNVYIIIYDIYSILFSSVNIGAIFFSEPLLKALASPPQII